MGRGSRYRKVRKMKKNGEFKIEWYRECESKRAGTCVRCHSPYSTGDMVNGNYKYLMHSACWDEHLKERRP